MVFDVYDACKWLETMIKTHASVQAGIGEATGVTGDVDYPYAVIHPITSARAQDALVNPDAGVDVTLQVDSVGARIDQCGRLQGRIRSLILDRDSQTGVYACEHNADVAGFTLVQRFHLFGPTPYTATGEVPDRVVSSQEQFRFIFDRR